MSYNTWWKKFVSCFNGKSETFEPKKDFKKACSLSKERKEFDKLRRQYHSWRIDSHNDKSKYDRLRYLWKKLRLKFTKK